MLIILSGVPGSGKTTWATNYCKNENLLDIAISDIAYVSRDSIRFSFLKDGDDYFKYEDKVWEEYIRQLQEGLDTKKHIIADATHLTKASRGKLLNSLNTHDHKLVGINFDISLKECIKRNELREGLCRVPEETIRKMFKYKEDIEESEVDVILTCKNI